MLTQQEPPNQPPPAHNAGRPLDSTTQDIMPGYTRIPASGDHSLSSPTTPPHHSAAPFPLNLVPILSQGSPSPPRYGYGTSLDDVALEQMTDDAPTRFIRLLGITKVSAEKSSAGKADESVQPEIVGTASTVDVPSALLNGELLVDVLDAGNEDPFTLEPFESLIAMHAEDNKDFILARVTTVDPQDETRFYYSYYAAHHINKVLFRTQPEESLLHRMKAKNPLNNMTIVGDVHYYAVKPFAVPSSAMYSSPNVSTTSFDSILTTSSSSSSSTLRARELLRKSKNPRTQQHQELLPKSSILQSNLRKLFGMQPQHGRRILHLIMKPEVFESETTNVDTTTEKPRRNSADDVYSGMLSIPSLAPSARMSLDSSRVLRNENSNSQEMSRLHIPIRSIVYSNNTENLNVYEWVRIHSAKDDRRNVSNKSSTKPGLRQRSASPSRPSTVLVNCYPTPPRDAPKRTTTPEVESQPHAFTAPVYYDARYVGSDDDFLMKSAVRAYFRDNALETADAVLFSVPSSVVVVTNPDRNYPGNEVRTDSAEQHPALPGFAYEVRESWDNFTFFGIKIDIDRSKALKWAFLGYCIIGVLVVKFVVPASVAYLVAFLLVFVLCLVLILSV
ncbi:hypothetical protein SeMB42_g00818 [Synchytrium endobioticum]|uniref:Uncharacterized protein n=1 Tax=Synchytrium endobioticum TaxID=286115 RepID=A0A507DP19_9FUNG|nr:hypothetical protein SeMB42_g00818 [Synchytrium endobioticum]